MLTMTKKNETTNFDQQCVICCDATKCIAIIPCGHVSTCIDCFNKLNVSNRRRCPICQSNITSFVKIFL